MTKTVRVTRVERVARPTSVIDLTIKNNGNMFVSASPDGPFMLAHNCFMERNGLLMDRQYIIKMQGPTSPLLKEIRDAEAKFMGMPEVQEAAKRLLAQRNVRSGTGLFGRKTENSRAFDPGKPAHLQMLFFEVMKLKPVSFTKGGARAINDAFKKRYKRNPVVFAFTDLEEIKKLNGTFIAGFYKILKKFPDNRDGRIRTYYGYLNVKTGRCLAPFVKILTQRGEIPISEVVVGDEVWTHKNRWRRVTATWIKPAESMLTVYLSNGRSIVGTRGHRVLDARRTWVDVATVWARVADVRAIEERLVALQLRRTHLEELLKQAPSE